MPPVGISIFSASHYPEFYLVFFVVGPRATWLVGLPLDQLSRDVVIDASGPDYRLKASVLGGTLHVPGR